MTKYKIAKQLGISEQAVYQWYKGETLPSQVNLMALSKLLKERPEKLLADFLHKKAQYTTARSS